MHGADFVAVQVVGQVVPKLCQRSWSRRPPGTMSVARRQRSAGNSTDMSTSPRAVPITRLTCDVRRGLQPGSIRPIVTQFPDSSVAHRRASTHPSVRIPSMAHIQTPWPTNTYCACAVEVYCCLRDTHDEQGPGVRHVAAFLPWLPTLPNPPCVSIWTRMV